MKHLIVCCTHVLGFVFASGGTAHAQACGSMQDLGNFQGSYSAGYSASADGGVVIGRAGNPSRAFRWTIAGGMQDLGTLGGTSGVANDVSADGSVVVGYSVLPDNFIQRAFRWTSETGMKDLGTLGGFYSRADGVSADGNVVVGAATTLPSQTSHAFRWTAATGMEQIGTWPSEAKDVSSDGSVVVGFVKGPNGKRAFRWTSAGGMQELGVLPGPWPYDASEAMGVSADGNIVVGRAYDSVLAKERAFKWTSQDGMKDLGALANDSRAYSVTNDGAVVGSSYLGKDLPVRWTVSGQILELGSLGGFNGGQAYCVTPDGKFVVGRSSVIGASWHAFRMLDCTGCTADCDGSGMLSIDDFVCFQTLYAIGDPQSDCDGDGAFSVEDFICFQTSYASGC